jgi:hypothetical protein
MVGCLVGRRKVYYGVVGWLLSYSSCVGESLTFISAGQRLAGTYLTYIGRYLLPRYLCTCRWQLKYLMSLSWVRQTSADVLVYYFPGGSTSVL